MHSAGGHGNGPLEGEFSTNAFQQQHPAARPQYSSPYLAMHNQHPHAHVHSYRSSSVSVDSEIVGDENQPFFGHEREEAEVALSDYEGAEKASPSMQSQQAQHATSQFYFNSLPPAASNASSISPSSAVQSSPQKPNLSSGSSQELRTASANYSLSKKNDAYQHRFSPESGVVNINLQGTLKNKAPNTFVTRSLSKLKAVTNIVQVRVKRAMSVAPSGSILAGSSTTPSAYDRMKQNSIRKWKDVPAGVREKILFVVSSLLGTAFFFILFESFMRVSGYYLSFNEEQIFTLSYVAAYLISILYQHMLNRVLIFRNAPYCSSLCHTYFVYSISLVILTTVGAVLIRVAHINPRVIACFTLPSSGVLNYALLKMCLLGNTSMAPNTEKHLQLDRNLLIMEMFPPSNAAVGAGSRASLAHASAIGGGNGSTNSLTSMDSTPSSSSTNLVAIGLALGSPGAMHVSPSPVVIPSTQGGPGGLLGAGNPNVSGLLANVGTPGARRYTVDANRAGNKMHSYSYATTSYSNA
jgi:hypothetical protein